MADGTRAKHTESRLDAMEGGMRQYREQVDDCLDLLELGIRNMQEEINWSRSEYAANLDRTMDRAVNGLQEEIAGLSQQLHQQLSAALSILAQQPHASLPTDFPPRASSALILMTPGER